MRLLQLALCSVALGGCTAIVDHFSFQDLDAGVEGRDGGMEDGGRADAGLRDAGDPGVDSGPADAGQDAGQEDAGPGDPCDTLDCPWGCSAGACVEPSEIVAGGAHSCVVLSTDATRCWGKNTDGRLGDGSFADSSSPVTVMGLPAHRSLSLGGGHSCAVRPSGETLCWGLNLFGQLGDGSTEDANAPQLVSGLSSADVVSAGAFHTCAVLRSGAVRCWGQNDKGGLGNGTTTGTTTPNPEPVAVMDISDAVSVATGSGFSCALRSGGTVSCWGWNEFGQLGDGTTVMWSTTPTDVVGLSGVDQVVAGGWHACARIGGDVRCWGRNDSGQLGTTLFGAIEREPVDVSGITDAVDIAAGGAHTCALRATGQVVCWGSNDLGQVGDGTDVDPRPTRREVVGLTGIVAIDSLANHTCAADGGEVWCWGSNEFGQLGSAVVASSNEPLLVMP